jgi:hypothetical protein
MTIQYVDGRKVQGVVLFRGDDEVRVAVEGVEDAVVFTRRSGTWVSDDCEPVRLEFAWQRRLHTEEVSEDDCICSQDLASRLRQLLLSDSETVVPMPLPKVRSAAAGSLPLTI